MYDKLDCSQHAENEMEPILLEIPEGGKSFNVNPHGGEEFGYVVDGSVILVIGDKIFGKREKPLHNGKGFPLYS